MDNWLVTKVVCLVIGACTVIVGSVLWVEFIVQNIMGWHLLVRFGVVFGSALTVAMITDAVRVWFHKYV